MFTTLDMTRAGVRFSIPLGRPSTHVGPGSISKYNLETHYYSKKVIIIISCENLLVVDEKKARFTLEQDVLKRKYKFKWTYFQCYLVPCTSASIYTCVYVCMRYGRFLLKILRSAGFLAFHSNARCTSNVHSTRPMSVIVWTLGSIFPAAHNIAKLTISMAQIFRAFDSKGMMLT